MKKIGLVGIIVMTAAFVMLVIGCATQIDINKLPSVPVNERLEGAWKDVTEVVLRFHGNRFSLTNYKGDVMEGVVKRCTDETITLTLLLGDRKSSVDATFRYEVLEDEEDGGIILTSATGNKVEMLLESLYLKITE